MTEVVIAVFGCASSAQAAADDLAGACLPSVLVRQFVSDPGAPEGLLEVHAKTATSGDRIIAVIVDEPHIGLVMDIVGMHGPMSMTEAPLAAA